MIRKSTLVCVTAKQIRHAGGLCHGGIAGSALLVLCLQGCAGIEPWEHQYHADPIMQLVDDGEELSYEQHMFRALAQGLTGAPVGGGGCGCEQ